MLSNPISWQERSAKPQRFRVLHIRGSARRERSKVLAYAWVREDYGRSVVWHTPDLGKCTCMPALYPPRKNSAARLPADQSEPAGRSWVLATTLNSHVRSEERRVGKECVRRCRCRGSLYP